MSSAFRSAPHARRPPSTRRSPLYPVPAQHSSNKPRSSQQGSSQQTRKLRPVQNTPQGKPPLRAVASPAGGVATVKRFPTTRAMPLWLRLLIQAQRGSMVVAFILVTATLIVYGSTVYTQQLWSKEYRRLKADQRNELGMKVASEGLKNQSALQAGRPGSGLVPQTPDSTIFLQPALQRPAPSTSPTVPKAEVSPNTPLGY